MADPEGKHRTIPPGIAAAASLPWATAAPGEAVEHFRRSRWPLAGHGGDAARRSPDPATPGRRRWANACGQTPSGSSPRRPGWRPRCPTAKAAPRCCEALGPALAESGRARGGPANVFQAARCAERRPSAPQPHRRRRMVPAVAGRPRGSPRFWPPAAPQQAGPRPAGGRAAQRRPARRVHRRLSRAPAGPGGAAAAGRAALRARGRAAPAGRGRDGAAGAGGRGHRPPGRGAAAGQAAAVRRLLLPAAGRSAWPPRPAATAAPAGRWPRRRAAVCRPTTRCGGPSNGPPGPAARSKSCRPARTPASCSVAACRSRSTNP